MLYGLSESQTKIAAEPQAHAFCPDCGGKLIAKCGEIKVWHWAHETVANCDLWHEPETDWHLRWKSHWPAECVEIAIQRDSIKHRADVVTPEGVVIEFQHSPISTTDIANREVFYGNMRWVFDVREAHGKELLQFRECRGNKRDIFHWKHARQSIFHADFKPTYLDINNSLFELQAWRNNRDDTSEDIWWGTYLSEDDRMQAALLLQAKTEYKTVGISGAGKFYQSSAFIKRHGGI